MPNKEIGEIFTKNLKQLLLDNAMTSKEFADKIGFKASSVSMWLTGKSLPRMGTLDKIADLFNVTVEDLVTERKSEPITIAAHFEGDKFTPEELRQIEQFVEFVKSKRPPKEEIFLNAAHDMGATPEQRWTAESIMQDDSEWDDIPAPKRATAPTHRHEEELLAAHARTDVEQTPEDIQHDLDIMNDDSKWNK